MEQRFASAGMLFQLAITPGVVEAIISRYSMRSRIQPRLISYSLQLPGMRIQITTVFPGIPPIME
jgi:hypothetical protein